MLLSVIIPVFNVAPYIEKCVRSVCDQDMPGSDYEIILVNDGSTDNSREVILALQQEFAHIVFIDQENQGVSRARNNAIACARGEYLMPIDPDDYVIPHTLATHLNRAVREQLDILQLSYEFLDENGASVWKTDYQRLAGPVYSGPEAYYAFRGKSVRDPDRSVAILFNREFLKRFRIAYPLDVPYLEDGLFLAMAFAVAQRCAFDASPFYVRTTRMGSATNSDLYFSDRAVRGFLMAVRDLTEFRNNTALQPGQYRFLNQPITKFILLAAQSSLGNRGEMHLDAVLAALRKMGMLRCPLAGCNRFYTRDGWVFNRSPRLYRYYKPIAVKLETLFYRWFGIAI